MANIGYSGLIGVLTGISKNGMSVGEKVMYDRTPSAYPIPPTTSYWGKPWMFVLRDTLQFAKNKDDVYNFLNSVDRTAMIHLGWGSLPDRSFRGYDYAANILYAYDDKNYTHYSEAHPQLDGVFFYNKLI